MHFQKPTFCGVNAQSWWCLMQPGNMTLDDKGYFMSLALKVALFSCYSMVNRSVTLFSPHPIVRAVFLGGTQQI